MQVKVPSSDEEDQFEISEQPAQQVTFNEKAFASNQKNLTHKL